MNKHREHLIALWYSGMCIVLFFIVVGCVGQIPVEKTTPVIAQPSPRPPTLTPILCCLYRHLPPLCDIQPGQSTKEEVKKKLGEPFSIQQGTPYMARAAGIDAEVAWQYSYNCPITVYFNAEVVSVIDYPFKNEGKLEDFVATYGTPQKIRAISYYKMEEDPEPAYWGVIFLWPNAGVAVIGSLLDLQPLDPEAITLDALPPFPADLPIISLIYYQSTDLQGISNILFKDEPLASWPGMLK